MSLMLTPLMRPEHSLKCSKPVFGTENYFHYLRNKTRGKIQPLVRMFLLHLLNLESQPALLNLNIKGHEYIKFALIIKIFRVKSLHSSGYKLPWLTFQ